MVGTPFVAEDDARFVVTQAVPDQIGVIVQGASQRAAMPFKDGVYCLGRPTERVEAILFDADGAGATSGSVVTNGGVAPGDTRYYQCWFRDAGQFSPCGSGSNFTNGVRIAWL